MQSKEKDNLIIIRLFPGENIIEQLKIVCEKHNVETGVVLSGLGQLKSCELGFFKEKGNYLPEKFESPKELLSLTGNISKQGKEYNLHLHSVFGGPNKQTIGGHFINGTVSITGEIILLKTSIKIKREIEPESGLKGLFLNN